MVQKVPICYPIYKISHSWDLGHGNISCHLKKTLTTFKQLYSALKYSVFL